MQSALIRRVQRAWAALAGVPVDSFAPTRPPWVVVSPASRICPTGWVGMVEIDGSIVATAPSAHDAELAGDALASSLAMHSWPEMLTQRLGTAQVLGPASLYYLDSDNDRLAYSHELMESVPATSTDLAQLLRCVDDEDAGESGLASISSRAFVVRSEGVVISAAGYRRWPSDIAHLSVLTAVSARGRGMATRTAGAATADAVRHLLLPQWRARPAASRRVAEHLGFQKLGWQLSFKLSGEP